MRTQDLNRPLTLEELERWVAFGARWRLVESLGSNAIVDLCQCTGELVERRNTEDPRVLDYIRSHASDE